MRVRRITPVALPGVVTMAAALSFAQPLSQPQFEVAIVKLSAPPEGDLINIDLGSFRNGRLTLTNVTLNDAIKFAYGLVSDDQLVGPAWNRSVRFDIVALAPPSTPPDQLHRMLQQLLAERLHVVLRREKKTAGYLALVVGKTGPKLPRAKAPEPTLPGQQVRGLINHNQLPLSRLAQLLSRFERQTIIDETGLTGLFEIRLEWAPDDPSKPPSDKPGLFAAVQEQLGLKLEARRGPLDVLIVEHASQVPESN